ncbi:chaplin family protein [Asanoa sp. WMMD1127]|uniref:chaplin family protein n=1 Tax=Asanoa sp. WMMD1127 TaxID=3016107 RepID=UPI0024177C1E|nr:chaplin family protein [Asanoa sp. WMMD1127]MDG4822214.1 chaplin family protein [Asanoa sp. WMMD1127]
MKTWVRKSISVGVMAAGGLLTAQAAAQADIVTTNNFGALNGTQVVVPIQAPINLCGNSIALIGGAFADCGGGAVAVNGGGGQEDPDDNGYDSRRHADDEFAKAAEGQKKKHAKNNRGAALAGGSNIVSSGNYGLLNGTQVVVPIQAPINIAGNAIGIIGGAFASADGGAVAVNESARAESTSREEANLVSTNNFGALNGTQLYAPIQVPINVCGNAIALIGGAFASCGGGAVAVNESAREEGGREEANLISANNFGLLNGTQLYAPIQIPINVCGNAIALIGGAFASCGGGAIAFNGESASTESARDEALPLVGSLPAVAGLPVVGQLAGGTAAPAAPKMDAPGARSGATEGDDYDGDRHGKKHGKRGDDRGGFGGAVAVNRTGNIVSSNNFGALNGTQVVVPIQVPVNVAGNAVGVIGGAFAQATGGALAVNG